MSTTKLTLAQKVANLNTPLTWDNIQNKPPFGTEANTILEGSKFIEGLGVNGYGGTIQDPGQKVAGKCYFDINTKSLFLCKTTNNLTSPNSDYFTSFDNKSLLNKLENLLTFRTEAVTLVSDKGTTGTFFFVVRGSVGLMYCMNIEVRNEYKTVFNLPGWFCELYISVLGSFTNGTGGAGGEAAEVVMDTDNRKLEVYPGVRAAFGGNLQLSGQITTLTRKKIL